jgi:capsular exopolysaccharide synthesis family protein
MNDINIKDNDSIDIKGEVQKYFSYWRLFLISSILFLFLAFMFIRYSTAVYNVNATIMIKDNKQSGISTELAAFEDLGILGGGSANNPENEIEILKSRKIIGMVIDSLNLDISYLREGKIKNAELYDKTNPLVFDIIKKNPVLIEKDTSFLISIIDSYKFEIKDINEELKNVHTFGELVESKVGSFKVSLNKSFVDTNQFKENQKQVLVFLHPRNDLIDSYLEITKITATEDLSPVLKLNITTNIRQKGEEFLDELIKQYNLDGINDENLISLKTINFIDDRLVTIGKSLTLVQDKVKNYKIDNKITGLTGEAELSLESFSKSTKELVTIKTELELAKWINESLKKTKKNEETLPQNLGFSDLAISQGIEKYNLLILEKNKLAVNAGKSNPLLVEYKKQINSIRFGLERSISNLITSLKIKQKQIGNESSKLDAKISSLPYMEREFIDIAREQEIISGLYSYLLKKREETSISLAITVANAKIIDVAYGAKEPISPKKKIIYLGFLVIGLILPFGFIYFKDLLDTKIHSRKDIEEITSIPFLGDVPHSETDNKVVIKNDARTSIAESFRLIRTNLDFMLTDKIENKGKIIFVTSTTSGEGKSFISINLAAALSLSNKKVLLLGMDLRAPKVTEYLGIPKRKGVTNFITNASVTLKEIIFSIPEINGLDIISSGVIPPNPAELLLGDRTKQLFEEVENDYDFIIVDTAPVNLVTDTFLISKYADITLYVSRANYLDKRMLKVAQNLYNEKKLRNMAIVLNDTEMSRGYGYGYGYGYGVGYLEETKKPWYKRLFN